MSKQRSEYVSAQAVKKQLDIFKNTTVHDLLKAVNEKYSVVSVPIQEAVETFAWVKLSNALYLRCSFSAGYPSYRQQIMILQDFAQLLENAHPDQLSYFRENTPYWDSFVGMRTFLQAKHDFDKSQIICNEFFGQFPFLGKENFLEAYYEQYASYAHDATRVYMIAMMGMLAQQIMKDFPELDQQSRCDLERMVQRSYVQSSESIAMVEQNNRKVAFQ